MEAKIKFGPWPSELTLECAGTIFKVPFESIPPTEIIDAYQGNIDALKNRFSVSRSYLIQGHEYVSIKALDHSPGTTHMVEDNWYEILDDRTVKCKSPYKYYYNGQLIHWGETIYNVGSTIDGKLFVDSEPDANGIIQLVKGTMYYFKSGGHILTHGYLYKVNKATVQDVLGYRYELVRTRGNIITVRSL